MTRPTRRQVVQVLPAIAGLVLFLAALGVLLVKLGEEARVDLTAFTLEGGRGARFRQVIRRLEKDGGTFRIIASEGIAAVVEQLRDVSDDWLQEKSAAEKGFSLGFFDAGYLSRFPAAVVERNGRMVAFANLWMDADRKVQPRVAAALPRVPGRDEAGPDPRRRVGADCRRVSSHLPQVAAAHTASVVSPRAAAYMYS